MGILNMTPDSFSDGGLFRDPEEAVDVASRMLASGADLIDVGGESTRPGAAEVDSAEEWRRIGEVVGALCRLGILVSVDTSRPAVAARAIEAGAVIINDVTALRAGTEMASIVAESGAGLVLMHMRGDPRTMQSDVAYADLLGDIGQFLSDSARNAERHGIEAENIVVDPGLGFGKSATGNLRIINRLDELAALGFPVLVGPSRKTFIGNVLGTGVGDRVEGTVAACVLARARGASIFRVHDVEPVRKALDVAHAILTEEAAGS